MVIEVAESAVMVPAVVPNLTDAPKRFCPLMVTVVPPAAGPDGGVTAVRTGLGR